MVEFLAPIFGIVALSAAMLLLAWLALGEYRRLFLANPRLAMSLEVFAVLSDMGGLGYVAAILAFCGAWLLMIATVLSILALSSILG